MSNEPAPVVDQWYRRLDKGELFRVVAVDAQGGAAEIQGFGGDIEEFDLDVWEEMDLEAVEAPEDCSGPYDELEPDDLGYKERRSNPPNWRLSLESVPGVEDRWNYTRTPEEFGEELVGPYELYEEK